MGDPLLSPRTTAALALVLIGTVTVPTRLTSQVHDSAGVQVVENKSIQSAPIRYFIGETPLLDIGGLQANPDEEFWSKSSTFATRLSDGRIVVLDGARILYFSPAGKLQQIIGRQGAGPGELRMVVSPCRSRGDTLIVNDVNNSRIVVIDPTGSVVRTIPAQGGFFLQACLGDGTVVHSGGTTWAAGQRMMMHMIATSTDGKQRHDFGTYPGLRLDLPTVSIRAWTSLLHVADPAAFEFRVYDLSGKLIRIVRTADSRQPVTKADIAAGRVGSTIIEVNPDGSRKSTSEPIAPKTYPAFAQILVDPAGAVWMQDARHVVPEGWTLFDKTGRLLGRLVPRARPEIERWKILEFGTQDVMVSRRDEDGAAHLTIYPLVVRP